MSVEKMDDDEVHQFLQNHSIGTLALADDNDSYAAPESFGYEDGVLYFYFVYQPESKKMEYVSKTDTAIITIYDNELLESVIVEGELEEMKTENSLVGGTIFAEQSEFPSLDFNIELPTEDHQTAFYKMEIEESTGRKFSANLE